MAYTAQVFLGTQIICAQCHDHPFAKWKQADYYAFAALSHGLNANAAQSLDLLKLDDRARAACMKVGDLEAARDALGTVLTPLKYAGTKYDPRRRLELPHDYRYSDHKPGDVLPPRMLFGAEAPAGLVDITDTRARLTALAEWMTAPENPRFTTVIVNRLWKRAFGLGLIEPVDEMMDSSVASNPALMRHLEQTMKDVRYSLRGFLRFLYNTRAYQRAAATTPPLPGESWHFTGPLLRRMTAEQLWDSLITLRHGDVDSHVSETNDHLNRYLAALRRLTDRVKQLGLSGVAEIAKTGAVREQEIARKVDAARAEMNKKPNPGKEEVQELNRYKTRLLNDERDLLLAQILDVKNLDGLGFDYKPSQDRNERKKGQKKPADIAE